MTIYKNNIQRKWLVTGVAGFIGSNLAEYLLINNQTVVGIDNFFTGKKENIERLKNTFASKFSFFETDILEISRIEKEIKDCEIVVHLAAQVSVIRSLDFPEETHQINSTGFIKVLNLSRLMDVETFIYASSCAVYGDNQISPLCENLLTYPKSPYAASKLSNEAYGSGFADISSKMKIIGLRFFNIYGPWQDCNSGYAAVIPKWISTLIEGHKPIIYGDGNSTRDYCYVENLCRAIYLIANKKNLSNNEIFNIGTGIETRLNDLYDLIIDILINKNLIKNYIKPSYLPERNGEILNSLSNIDKAKKFFDYNLDYDLEAGIKKLIDIDINYLKT